MSEKFNMLQVLLNSNRRPFRILFSEKPQKFENVCYASVVNAMFANVLPASVDTLDLVSCHDPEMTFQKIFDKTKTIRLRMYLDEALSEKKKNQMFSDVLNSIPSESNVFLSNLETLEGVLVYLGLKSNDHKIYLTPRLSLKSSVNDITGLNLYGKSIQKIRDAHNEVDASPVIQAQHLLVQALHFSKTNLEEFIDKSKERTISALIEKVSLFLKKCKLPHSPKMDPKACSVLSRLHEEEIYDPNVLIRLVQKHHIVSVRDFNRNQINLALFESFVDFVTEKKNEIHMRELRFQIPICDLKTKYLNVLPSMREKLSSSVFEKSDELAGILNVPSDEDIQRFTTREIEEIKKSKERTITIIDKKQILLPQDTSIPFTASLDDSKNNRTAKFQSVIHFIIIRWINFLRESDDEDITHLLTENVENVMQKSLDIERNLVKKRLIYWMREAMDNKFNAPCMKMLLYHINVLIKHHNVSLDVSKSFNELEQKILWSNMERSYSQIVKIKNENKVIEDKSVENMFLNEYSTHLDKIATIVSNHLSEQISILFSPNNQCLDEAIQNFITHVFMARGDQSSPFDIVERFTKKMSKRIDNPNRLTTSGKIIFFSLARTTVDDALEIIKTFMKRVICRIPTSEQCSRNHFWTNELFEKVIYNVLTGKELRTESLNSNWMNENSSSLRFDGLARLINQKCDDTVFFRLRMFETV
jgi:chloramphenicol O-acetyltransferase